MSVKHGKIRPESGGRPPGGQPKRPAESTRGRLRGVGVRPPFHVVLVEPEIPPNTGNIARLCAATSCQLRLVGTLGFEVTDHAVRRAGLDYWSLVDVFRHPDLADAERAVQAAAGPGRSPTSWLFSGHSDRSYLDVPFLPGDALVFGRESVGLPADLLAARRDRVVAVPTTGAVRSLNLSNTVAIVLYEALRRNGGLAPCGRF